MTVGLDARPAARREQSPVAPTTLSLADRMREIVERLGPLHARLCPRQILGARIGLRAASARGPTIVQPHLAFRARLPPA